MGLRSSDDPYVPENVEIMALRLRVTLAEAEVTELRAVMQAVLDSGPCHSDCFTATSLLEDALRPTSARRGDGT